MYILARLQVSKQSGMYALARLQMNKQGGMYVLARLECELNRVVCMHLLGCRCVNSVICI